MDKELLEALQGLRTAIETQSARLAGTLPVPLIINDASADPAIRSAALDQYTSVLTSIVRAENFTPEQRRAVEQRIAQVLREGGF